MAEDGGGRPWEQLKLTWETRGDALCRMVRGAAVAHDNLTYFSSDLGDEVFGYDSGTNNWSELPKCPQSDFGLAVVSNLLTAVGGVAGRQITNCLISFSGGKWFTVFPPMPTKRQCPATMSTQNHLIAAGGMGEGGVLSTVEVMDVNSLKWYTAASLPEPVHYMSATVCRGHLYLLGGRYKNYKLTHVVFTSTLDSLHHSCHPPSPTVPHNSEADVIWHRVADVPVRGSTCTTFKGRVLAVGGVDSHGNDTAFVHLYDSDSDSWLLLGNMPTGRWKCLVMGLKECIIAVGGYTSTMYTRCATVEVGYLQLSGVCFHICMLYNSSIGLLIGLGLSPNVAPLI